LFFGRCKKDPLVPATVFNKAGKEEGKGGGEGTQHQALDKTLGPSRRKMGKEKGIVAPDLSTRQRLKILVGDLFREIRQRISGQGSAGREIQANV